MSKVEINVQPVIDLIKSEIKGLDYVRTFKGRGKKEGHFLIRAAISTDKDLDIDIDVAQMVSNKNSAPVFDNGTKPSSSMIRRCWLASWFCGGRG